jgi:hypothetical protein
MSEAWARVRVTTIRRPVRGSFFGSGMCVSSI